MTQEIYIWHTLFFETWIVLMLRGRKFCFLPKTMVSLLSLRWRRSCAWGLGSPLHPPLSSNPLIPSINATLLLLSFTGCTLLIIHPPPNAACSPPRTSLQLVTSALMLTSLWSLRIHLSHVWAFVYPGPSSILGFRMSIQNPSSATSGIFEIQRILGQVVLGVSEGWL